MSRSTRDLLVFTVFTPTALCTDTQINGCKCLLTGMQRLEVLSSTVGLRAHGLKKVLCCSLTLWYFVKIRLVTSAQTVLHVFFLL